MAQSYYTPFTIQTAQVPSTQTNFPALVVASAARFKTIANGGHVQTGNDIRPYSDSTLTTALTYEMEFYDGLNGIWYGWVLLASAADALVIYLGYGDAALSSDGSSSATWANSFGAVYHLGDGSSLVLTDSTSNANTLSNDSITATTGKIKGGALFDGFEPHRLSKAVSSGINLGTEQTMSLWINPTSFANHDGDGTLYISNQNPVGLTLDSSGHVTALIGTSSADRISVSSGTLSTGVFTMLHATWSTSDNLWRLYANASEMSYTTQNAGSGTTNSDGTLLSIGAAWNNEYFGNYYGVMDEVRISTVKRSANWITTEYNNQSNNSAFWTTGAESAVGGGGPVFITSPVRPLIPGLRRTQIIQI